MGYTIHIHEQVTPRTTPVKVYDDEALVYQPNPPPEGWEQPFRWEDQPTPVPARTYPATHRRELYEYNFDPYSEDPARRAVLIQDDAGTATIEEITAMFPEMIVSMRFYIKYIRESALAVIPKNAGVLAVYDENYKAAVAVIEGRGAEVMKDGSSALAFLSRFGEKFGMTAEQFAGYIIGENRRVNPTTVAIEERYLALCYGGDPANGIVPIASLPTITAMRQAVIDYADFCGYGEPPWGSRDSYAEV